MVKISIVIPTFNSEKFLKNTLDSILSQTYKNYEVIICDNFSKDKTRSIVKYYSKSCKKIRFFQKVDSGVAEALNFGFSKAKGQLLCWLNSDDLYFHNNILNIISQTYKKNKFDFIVGNFVNINEQNKIIKSFYSFIPKNKIKYYFYYNQIFTGSLFFSKDVYKKFNCFDISYKYAFEYEIIFFLLKNFKGHYINEFLSCFRILPTALSSNKILLKKEMCALLKKYHLIYTNCLFFRIFSYFRNNNFLHVIVNKFFDRYVNSNIKF
jgi:glycosyltransferase involved in cell wall biosynthesis